MDDVRHELLEARILHARDALSPFKVGGRGVTSLLTLACVVDQKFRDFTECAAFLAIVDDDTKAAVLRTADAFLDAVHEVWTAGADVGAEDVGTVAFVMDPARHNGARILKPLDVAEQINRDASNRWQEDLQIGARYQFR